MKPLLLIIIVSYYSCFVFGQQIVVDEIQKVENEDPLRPAKAAFYSAVLPGLGQYITESIGKFLLFMVLLALQFIPMI